MENIFMALTYVVGIVAIVVLAIWFLFKIISGKW